MKTTIMLLVSLCFLFSNANTQIKLKPYYDYQFGFETGVGGVGERNIYFIGAQAGTFYRINNHQFGARIAGFIRGFLYDRDDFTTINVYYGFAFASKTVSISPQLGGGYYNRYQTIRNNWHKYNLEVAVEIAFTKSGNGIYIRPFYTWNPNNNYLGITAGGRFGYAWKNK